MLREIVLSGSSGQERCHRLHGILYVARSEGRANKPRNGAAALHPVRIKEKMSLAITSRGMTLAPASPLSSVKQARLGVGNDLRMNHRRFQTLHKITTVTAHREQARPRSAGDEKQIPWWVTGHSPRFPDEQPAEVHSIVPTAPINMPAMMWHPARLRARKLTPQ